MATKKDNTAQPTLKQLASASDAWWRARAARLAAQKKVEELQKKENELKEYLISNVGKSQSTGVAGKLVRISIDTEDVPVVEDKDKFRAYINRTKRFDLAQSLKPAAAAVREMWEAGKTIPGVGKFTATKLKYNQIK